MIAEGSNGSVEFLGQAVVIRRKGLANKLTQGFQGDKRIPVRSITAIQFRPAGSVMAGVIQFSMVGGQEHPGGMLAATRDENAVMFTSVQEAAFLRLRESVQEVMEAPSHAGGAPIVPGGADELERLVALLEKGHLSSDEFSEAKRRALVGEVGRQMPLDRPSATSERPHPIRSMTGPSAEPAQAAVSGDRAKAGISRDLLLLIAAVLILSIFGAIESVKP